MNEKIGWGAFAFVLILSAFILILNIGGFKQAGISGAQNENIYEEEDLTIFAPEPAQYYEDENGELIARKPNPLYIEFNDSAAKIDLIGGEAKGAKLSPKCEGVWKWDNEYRLSFTPKNEWAAGQKYTIKLPKKIFNSQIKLSKYSYKIQLSPFRAKLLSFQLFENPQNPQEHNLQAEFSFSHSVDIKSLQKNISLTLDGQPLKFAVSFNKAAVKAYIVSDSVEITDKNQIAILNIGAIKSIGGAEALLIDATEGLPIRPLVKGMSAAENKIRTLKKEIEISDKDDFLKFLYVRSIIVNNNQDELQQILSAAFNNSINADDLSRHIKAYLLPVKNPRIQDKNSDKEDYSYNWTYSDLIYENMYGEGGIDKDIIKISQNLALDFVSSQENAKSYSFKYNAQDIKDRWIFVIISSGLQSASGFKLAKDAVGIIKSAKIPKEAKFIGGGSILSLAGSQNLSVKTRGVKAVKVEIARVMKDEINHLASQTQGDFSNPKFLSPNLFNENNISQKFTKIIRLTQDLSKTQYASVDLGALLKSKNASGIFFVKVQGYDEQTKKTDNISDNRMIILSDLSVIIKRDISGKNNVFVSSIKTGLPLENAKVEILGKNGLAVLIKNTNKEGLAVLESASNFSNEKAPVAFIITKGSDISFMPFARNDRNVNYSKFDIGGERASIKNQGLKAFIFSDRGIYRPGGDLNFGIIVKDEKWKNLSGVPVKFVLKDPSDKNIFEKIVSLNSDGYFSIDKIPTQISYQTGSYWAYIYTLKDKDESAMLGSLSVRIEEFRTDSMKVNAKITGALAQGWTILDNLKGEVSASNLFGSPAQGRAVGASYSLTPAEFVFAKYEGYIFPAPNRIDNKKEITPITESLPNLITDEKGCAQYDFDFSKYESGLFNLSFFAEVSEGASGKTVSVYTSIKASKNKELIGYKTASKLEFLNKNSAASINIIAIDNSLKPAALKNLKLNLSQIQNNSALVRDESGAYKYQTVSKTVLISKRDFNIAQKPEILKLNTSKSGSFMLEIENEKGETLLKIPYFVAGASNQDYALEKDAVITMSLKEDEIRQGGTLALNIAAPYAGTGLITIEKDKVYAHKWFKINTNNTVQTITVPKDLEGGAYVNVSFMRSFNSKEIFSNPYSYGIIPFKINLAKKTLKVDLKAPQIIRSGETLNISYKTSEKSKIIVYGVNEGILQVIKYTLPNPLTFFFAKKALQVNTMQIADMILPEYKIIKQVSSIGGGFAYAAERSSKDLLFNKAEVSVSKNLNPFSRRIDKPVVFWSKILNADDKERTIKFKLPNSFNGAFRIMAVAANASQIGGAQRGVLVKSPIIISPIAPLAAVEGDIFEVSASVSNNIDGKDYSDMAVSLETNGMFEIIGTANQNANIEKGAQKTFIWTLKAKNKLGSGDLKFIAGSGNEKTVSNLSISVRPLNGIYQTIIKSRQSSNNKIKIDAISTNLYDDFADRQISASYNPQILFQTLQNYFKTYPYACTEQIISAAFPFIFVQTMNPNLISQKDRQILFDETLAKIRQRQQSGGGFALWDWNGHAQNFTSIYAMHFFTDAKDLNYPVPPQILFAGRDYLFNFAQSLPKNLDDARLKSYAAYVLTRNGAAVANILMGLEDYLNRNHKNWQKDITGSYIAACYVLLKNFDKAQKLFDAYTPEKEKDFVLYSDFDSSSQRNAVYLYLYNRHFSAKANPNAQNIAQGLVQTILDGKFNTISSSYALLALLSYGENAQTKDGGIKIFATDSNNKTAEMSLVQKVFPTTKFLSDVKSFEINSNGEGNMYYCVVQKGFQKEVKEYAKGIELSRQYLDEKGEPIKEAKIGEEITVRIRARITNKGEYRLAITDLLPSCFEIISDTRKGGFESSDMREDRANFYVLASGTVSEISYKVKVVSKGKFNIPPLYACAMYEPSISAMTKASKIESK
ncbi:MAG: alpha-2-macroglobulin family protein [Elusimicrobiota bacterium]|jgi:uncharacterized protein YfaS (alpha-2-macroglobulin family)|nr:alpha-2-macroglobulin family protein [Elusimicrobiota bacterium]